MRHLVVVAIGCALASSASTAHALCISALPELAPASGTLPPNATIYLWVPNEVTGRIVASVPVTVDSTEQRRYIVHRIRIHATSGHVHVRFPYTLDGFEDQLTADFTIGPTLAPNTARVATVDHHASRWTCSSSDLIRLAVEGNAIAYRFDWRGDDVPTPLTVRADEVVLGRISCIGSNVSGIGQPRAFDLVALFADGSERRLGHSSLMLGRDKVQLPLELVGGTGTIRAKRQARDDRRMMRDDAEQMSRRIDREAASYGDGDGEPSRAFALLGAFAGLAALGLATRRIL